MPKAIYFSHTLPNGLRIIHRQFPSEISFCGFAINTGTRDENKDEYGMAHFVEHMLFKGTHKRKAHHIAGCMGNVGGDLNAFTTKEETFIYSVFLEEYFERATELLCDLVFNSDFPSVQIEREREVILDEIATYDDSPTELIYDDFENLLFQNHELGHYILGTSESLERFDTSAVKQFIERQYNPQQMVFFSFGKTPFQKICRWVEKYVPLSNITLNQPLVRTMPNSIIAQKEIISKDTAQTHVVVGNKGLSMFDENRYALSLLSNLLGGESLNSRLNTSLREKNGLVYTVETSTAFYTDSGVFSVYFGCDPKHADRCVRLAKKEFDRLMQAPLTPVQLSIAKKQLKGQMAISAANYENMTLSMAKSFLHFNRYRQTDEIFEKIDSFSAEQLQSVAQTVLRNPNMVELRYV